MIPKKSFLSPSYTRRSVRRTLSLFGEENGALSVAALHFRKSGDKLVLAEGTERLQSLSADGVVLSAEGHGGGLFSYAEGALTRLSDGAAFALSSKPAAILSFLDDENGETEYFAVDEDGVRSLGADGSVTVVSENGGVCGCVHYERIFTAAGCRVRYSEPLAPDNWTQAVQGAGYVDLPSDGGEILSVCSYKEKLYLFRKCGITQLRALGDTLNFKAVKMPFSCGEIVNGSVQNCGEKVLFLTESGLFSFNGATCTRLGGYGASLIDATAPLSSAVYDGKYYCAVRLREGENCIFCADPAAKEGHFIRAAATSVAGGDALYFTENGHLCRLTAPDGNREGTLTVEQTLLGLSAGDKFLDAITVEGEGYFSVAARAERGLIRHVRGRAGERLVFPYPVRGNAFSFRIRTRSERAEIRAIVCEVREENSSW